jgi:class 3 adenylate cyclase/predicted ATPase
MDFVAVVDQVIVLLRQRGRVTYRTLQRQFQLDAEALTDLLAELRYAHPDALHEDDQGVVWTGDAGTAAALAPPSIPRAQHLEKPADLQAPAAPPGTALSTPDAERRQLTVLFGDLVDSTALSSQLDPEELREVVRAYQDTCAKVIARFDGHIAQYLGDGLLVYFGYPLAHEDDAQRAVRAGLGIVEALGPLNSRLTQERGVQLAVRVGIHTGLVVVGEVGGSTRQEQLALGETPNLAARLQGIAAPNTLVISTTTFQLLGGFFACQPLGTPLLKGLAQPLMVYRVLYESMARSRLEAVGSAGLTPLVGREQEIGLLQERWGQVKDGLGQVVLLSGEAGIGKSRLVQVLKDHVATESQAWLTPCQCSPYYQNTAFYPLIDLLERVVLRFDWEESPQQKLRKLEGLLVQHGLPLVEIVPPLAVLLSLQLPADYAPLTVSSEQQKQQTLHVLLTILLRMAAQQPVLFVMEDLHWADPSTLEFLSLLVDQGPTARILALFTFRSDFSPPWTGRSHLTQVALHRLTHPQAVEVIRQVAHGKALPAELVEQIAAKTDGVPLFVEELTKMVLESGLLQEWEDRYVLTRPLPPLAIPATLHDSLMARLDRLTAVKALAQLGATLGREFSYELLRAVSPWDEDTIQRGLHQLVAAEFLYQRGLPPLATYVFKHALIQEAAYQSLLRSTRQQYHQRIARVLAAQFPEIAETQPELVAHHYTEAGQVAQAIPSWQQAGERALARSAYREAANHLATALTLLPALPETRERSQQELTVLMALGMALRATRGQSAPEVEQLYTRARALCEQVGEPSQLFRVLWGLWHAYGQRVVYQMRQELGEQLLRVAQSLNDQDLLLEAHHALWTTVLSGDEPAAAWPHLEEGRQLYDPQRHRTHAALYSGHDPGVCCHMQAGLALWFLGYPDQAVPRIHAALALAQNLAHPLSLSMALRWAALLHHLRRETSLTQAHAEASIRLATDHGFPLQVALVQPLRGWALAMSGHGAEGRAEILQGLAGYRATGVAHDRTEHLALLATTAVQEGQSAEGLEALTRALTTVATSGVPWWHAELYRLRGELLLQQTVAQPEEAEASFHQALAIARRQEAKSLELWAARSLSRLWQQQGKQAEAYELLAPIYGWFTEGFDTADLQVAKALLAELEG